MSEQISYDKLEIGKCYQVVGEDCCIQAQFTGKLIVVNVEGETADFIVGVIPGPGFSGVVSISGHRWQMYKAELPKEPTDAPKVG